MIYHLSRFLEAQEQDYQIALSEIKTGRKCSHWMWYIFPQLKQLGFSSTSKYYGIENIEEAKEYLQHPILSSRYYEISEVVLGLDEDDPITIFGRTDAKKLKSSMTLFYLASKTNQNIFIKVLDKFYRGQLCKKNTKYS
jgi:uncharacterized protein (DUF1810 family)